MGRPHGLPGLPLGRCQQRAYQGGGKFYVAGGLDINRHGTTTVYDTDVTADGSMGAWTLESNSLPSNIGGGLQVFAKGNLYYIGGTDGTNFQTAAYKASLNQGTANAAKGSFVGRFNVGSVQSINHL